MNNCRYPLGILLISWLVVGNSLGADLPGDRKNVLVLYGERLDLPAIRILDQTFHEQFAAASSPAVDVFPEYFDFARFPAVQNDAIFTKYLHERYAGKKIDLVLPVTGSALDFALRHRDELFPGVPIVFVVLNPKDVPSPLPANVTGIAAHPDVGGTVDLALRLQPDAKEIVVVSGSAALDKNLLKQSAPILDGYAGRLPWRAVAGRSLAETVDEVRRVPGNDIVVLLSMISDSEGRALSIPEVARQLAPVSQAPIYGVTGTIMGSGSVGGSLVEFDVYAKKTCDLAFDVLRGHFTPYVFSPTSKDNPLIVDWRALQHWNLDASRLPANAEVKFRKPTMWAEHPRMVLGIFLICILQSALIAMLLFNHVRLRRSQQSLRESQQRPRQVLDAAPIAMIMMDNKGRIVLVNTGAENIFGYPRSELIGQSIEILIPERSRLQDVGDRNDYFAAPTMRTMGAGRELFGRRKDGSEVPVEIGLNPIQTAQGTSVLASIIDLSSRKEAEREMALLRQEIAHVDRVSMVGQLASALAHELNQPLGAILRNAEAAELFMQKPSPDLDEIRAILVDIRNDDRRAGAVIDRMRSLLRRQEVEMRPLDVAEFVSDIAALTRSDAAARHVKLGVEVPSALPPVLGDRVQLQQVLLNLILNGMDALDGHPDGARSVTMCAHRGHTNVVEIAVIDTGHGIQADRLDKLFDPFFTTKKQGLGIGLAISRTIIEAHGGRLWAENNEGKGATFRFTLRTAKEAARP